jgi:hypothetical protein
MATNKTAVFGVYDNESELNAGVDALRAAGYRNTDVSVLFPDHRGTKESGPVIVLGGPLSWLAGVGSVALPGLGPFIAAGPIVAALAGSGAGGTAVGLIGTLTGMGFPEHEAKRYEGRLRNGEILMSVHCSNVDWAGRAKRILRETGAEDIGSAGEAPATMRGGGRH